MVPQDKKQLVDFLRFKTYKGMSERGYPLTPEYVERIEYELGIIDQTGFAGYFLIVADLCRFMTSQGIRFIARGSGCGSVVVWAIGISHKWLDPVKFQIPFERFLNPQRISNPDIDIDIQDDRRHEVVQYTIDTYGADRVARIVTFGTLAAKASINDFARALDLPDYQHVAQNITGAIPGGKGDDGKNIRLGDLLKSNEFLRDQQKRYPELFDLAMRAEGKIRNASIHAAGTIIAPEELTHFLPLYFAGDPDTREPQDRFPATQLDMYDCEEMGLLKMDYLGLKTLRVIEWTQRQINFRRMREGLPPDFSVDNIDQHDQKTWELLAAGKLLGVFQVERTFVQGFARRMNLAALRDPWSLAVLVAIIRPGMMDAGTTEMYLRRAMGQEEPTPPHPLLHNTFRKTYGIMCFQECVMSAARDFAGFTQSEADVLRKGVGKKAPEFIKKQQPKFFEGAMQPLWEARWRDKSTGHEKVLRSKPRNPDLQKIAGGQPLVEGTVQTSDGPVELRMVMPGATREACEHIWGLIEAHSRYCFPAHQKIDRVGSTRKDRRDPTIGEMYRIRHDAEWAKANGYSGLHYKYRVKGFGKGLSLHEDGRVRPNDIYNIEPAGRQECFLVVTKSGNRLEATANHQFPTADGRRLKMSELTTGDALISMAPYEGYVPGVSPTYRIGRCVQRGGGYVGCGFPSGGQNPSFTDGEWTKFQEIRRERLELTRSSCELCKRPAKRLELDHKDRDRTNNSPDNLWLLCPSCHKKKEYANGRRRRGDKGYPTFADPIVSIESTGFHDTFNVSMAAPHHNLSVGGAITYNSFNNAHAAAYGMVVAYQTAYLKARHPIEFMTCLINSEAGSTDKELGYNHKVSEYVEEAKSMGIEVKPPCVQRSHSWCIVGQDYKSIIFGLTLIKGVKTSAVEWITTHCSKATSFKEFVLLSFEDELVSEVTADNETRRYYNPYSRVGKGTIEALITAGAFDVYDKDRAKLMAMLPEVLKQARKYHEHLCKQINKEQGLDARNTRAEPDRIREQLMSYSLDDDQYQPPSLEQQLDAEREVTGCYLSQSPFAPFWNRHLELMVSGQYSGQSYQSVRQTIAEWTTTSPAEMKDGEGSGQCVFPAIITGFREIIIKQGKKKGSPMAFLTLRGTNGDVEVTAFTDVWVDLKSRKPTTQCPDGYVERGKVYLVFARKDRNGGFILDAAYRLTDCIF